MYGHVFFLGTLAKDRRCTVHVCTVNTSDPLPVEAQGAHSESGGQLFEENTSERVPAVEDT